GESIEPGVERLELVERRHAGEDGQESSEDRHADDDRDRVVLAGERADPRPALPDRIGGPSARCRGHARSPSCWPRIPAGRNTRTMMRAAKTLASDQRANPLDAAATPMKPRPQPPSVA